MRPGSHRIHYHPVIVILANKMPDHALPLTCHPSTPTDAIASLIASATRDENGWLRFHFVVQGDVGRIILPATATPRHTDELWRNTCFEAFIATEDNSAYVECNFAPSGAWATYRFARYRKRMTTIVTAEPPRIMLNKERDNLVLEAILKIDEFASHPLRIGLTAVIEGKAGNLSYWALRHPRTGAQARPDFHHRGGFLLRLATH